MVPPYNTSVGALGVALQALELGIEKPSESGSAEERRNCGSEKLPIAPRLEIKETRFPRRQRYPEGGLSGKRSCLSGH